MQHWEMPGALPTSLCWVSSSQGKQRVGEAAHAHVPSPLIRQRVTRNSQTKYLVGGLLESRTSAGFLRALCCTQPSEQRVANRHPVSSVLCTGMR